MSSFAIRCQGLHKTYDGKLEAVRGIDLEIGRGECFGLLGPNGAGKTTTIEMLEGLLAPTSGQIEILGRNWRQHARELRERIGISLQETRLSEKLTVGETVRLFASFYRYPRPWRAVLEDLSLTEKRDAWVGKLSGGQRQRLAVACALVGNPAILFLDEPTTGLDPQSRRQLWEVVTDFQQRGGTIVLTTHYMEEAEKLCDRVAIVDHGRIMVMGTPAELIQQLGGHHVVEFAVGSNAAPADRDSAAEMAPQQMAGQLPGVRNVRADNGLIALNVDEPHRVIPELLEGLQRHGWRLAHLSTRQASLEDVFVQLTGRHLREE